MVRRRKILCLSAKGWLRFTNEVCDACATWKCTRLAAEWVACNRSTIDKLTASNVEIFLAQFDILQRVVRDRNRSENAHSKNAHNVKWSSWDTYKNYPAMILIGEDIFNKFITFLRACKPHVSVFSD